MNSWELIGLTAFSGVGIVTLIGVVHRIRLERDRRIGAARAFGHALENYRRQQTETLQRAIRDVEPVNGPFHQRGRIL